MYMDWAAESGPRKVTEGAGTFAPHAHVQAVSAENLMLVIKSRYHLPLARLFLFQHCRVSITAHTDSNCGV